jgi:hypothetical protein
MSKPKKNPASSNYVKTIREGAIAANIFRGNTPDGHTYLYFELSRSWKALSGNREGYSKKFYDRNADALIRVVQEASAWIEQHPEAADGPVAADPSNIQAAAA